MADEPIDEGRRRFLVSATSVVGGLGLASAVVPFAASWLPSEKAQAAGAPVEIDVSKLEPGQKMTVEWRGKPIWIIRRTQAAIDRLDKHVQQLRDPHSEIEQQPQYAKNLHRSIKPEFLVLIGLCTHLGCVPAYQPNIGEFGADWPGGFFCPCHGSTFDLSGRVFQGVPAPINLEVPPYKFVDEHLLVIGLHAEA